MSMQWGASTRFCGAALATWLLGISVAAAAPPTPTDLTDFITRLGGYLFPLPDQPGVRQHFWEQVSYKASTAAAPSNITTITVTIFPEVKIYGDSGTYNSAAASPASATPSAPVTALPTLLTPCAAENYTIETITLDLRDLQGATTSVRDVHGPVTPVPDGNVWSVTLKTRGGNFIRQNTQILPANCQAAGVQQDSGQTQKDVSQYTIFFDDAGQAQQFQNLVNNIIPALTPPALAAVTSPP